MSDQPPPLPNPDDPQHDVPFDFNASAAGTPAPHVTDLSTLNCIDCGYALAGLALDANCPECGTPIARSTRGAQLQFASLAYLTTLHRGARFIFIGLIAYAAISALSILVALTFPLLMMTGVNPPNLNSTAINLYTFTSALLGVGSTILTLVGWWMLSTPDPAQRTGNRGETPRKIVRIGIAAQLAFNLLSLPASITTIAAQPAVMYATLVVGGLSFIASVAAFFASMLYLRWLAPRIPNPGIEQHAKLLMWLGPLLMTVGWLACGLGPVAALILYIVLINSVRVDLLRLRTDRALRDAAGLI